MRARKVALALTGAVVLAASTAMVAGAFISGSSGQIIRLSSPPDSVAANALQSATAVYAFDESLGATLNAPLTVDAVDPGTYSAPERGKFTIPIGTHIDSHLVHSDVPKGSKPTRARSGSLTFPDVVLGLITTQKTLWNSDIVGAPGTTYSGNLKNRGFDAGQDSVTLSADKHTVSFAIVTEGAMDELRIITAHANLLATTITDTPDPVQAADSVTYHVTVTNGEPYTVPNVKVADQFPGATYVSASAAGGCSGTTTVTCTVGTLAPGAAASATIVVRTSTTTGTITNTASSPPGWDPIASETTTVVSPVLDTEIVDAPDPVTAGNDVRYTLKVTNNGIATVTAAHVVDTLPAGTTFVSASAPNDCTGTGPVDCSLGSVAVGETAEAQIVVTSPGTVPASGTITDTAVASPAANASASQVTTVQAPEPGSASGYVSPGDSLDTSGPDPTNLTLPPDSPGAPVVITQGNGTFCDGPCQGTTTTISAFAGYTDPNHPIHVTLTYTFPDSPTSLTDAATAFNSDIFKNTDPSHPNTGSIVPWCTNLGSGVADPHPCVDGHTITQPTYNNFVVTFEIVYLSGDPSYGRK